MSFKGFHNFFVTQGFQNALNCNPLIRGSCPVNFQGNILDFYVLIQFMDCLLRTLPVFEVHKTTLVVVHHFYRFNLPKSREHCPDVRLLDVQSQVRHIQRGNRLIFRQQHSFWLKTFLVQEVHHVACVFVVLPSSMFQ